MIKIEKFRILGGETFEVTYSGSGSEIQQQQRFRVREEKVTNNGGPSLKTLGSPDAAFHNYVGSHPKFRDALFRLAEAEKSNRPLELPLALP